METRIINGNHHADERGILTFNNNFNALGIKRVYTIQNTDCNFTRAWQGHEIEQKWFSAVSGSFIIRLIKIDLWENPSKDLPVSEFILDAENLDNFPCTRGLNQFNSSKRRAIKIACVCKL